MRSDLVKVLHEVCGRPMLEWVIDACRDAGCERIIVVVGHQGDRVRDAFSDDSRVEFVEQRERLGTGHAVMQAAPYLAGYEGDVFVLAGDGPLLRSETLRILLETHRAKAAAATLATAEVNDPTGYGRIVRDSGGAFEAIVEERDATPAQRRIREINPSYYCFRTPHLLEALDELSNENASGEYYLTDTLGALRARGERIALVTAVDPEDVLSVNTPEQLAEVDAILARRLKQQQEAAP